MKLSRRTAAFFGLLLVCSACSKVDDLLTFTISDQTSFTIEKSSPLNLPFEIGTPEVTTNSSQKFQNNNTSASLVKDVKLTELKLTITEPAAKTFSFLKSVHIYISTDKDAEMLLASYDDIPANLNTITLTPTQAKLDPYVKASSYQLRTQLVTRETLTEQVNVQVDLKFRVTAAPL